MTFPSCTSCGSRNLANEGEIVCRNCGVVQIEATINAGISASEAMGKAASADHHNPVNPLNLVEMGTPHDMISQGSLGLAMELCDPRGKDFEGRKITSELLQFGYVTGQVVGKNAKVVEVPGFNVWYRCGHSERFEEKYNPDGYCMDKKCRRYPTFAYPFAEPLIKHTIKEVHQFLIPKAKRNFRDDTIYRKAKVKGHQVATALKMDDVTRRYFGVELNKVYDEFVGKTDFLPLLALLRLKMTCPGLDVKMSAELNMAYNKMVEEMRLFLVEPQQKAQMVTV